MAPALSEFNFLGGLPTDELRPTPLLCHLTAAVESDLRRV